MAIQEVDGQFVLSAKHQWRPGSFESKTAAWHGQRLDDRTIQRLQDTANTRTPETGGVITLEDIQKGTR